MLIRKGEEKMKANMYSEKCIPDESSCTPNIGLLKGLDVVDQLFSSRKAVFDLYQVVPYSSCAKDCNVYAELTTKRARGCSGERTRG